MANGTITAITENTVNLSFSVTINGAVYTAVVSKAVFDALATNADKQNYVISVLSTVRRTARQYEAIYPALIGAAVVVPD
jgi:hypothetical protein